MIYKKAFLLALIFITLSTAVFAKSKKTEKNNSKSDTKIKIVTTIFPEYDWTREILGLEQGSLSSKNMEITLLINNGTDLHSYQPSIQDFTKLSTADIFIYVGGESDAWVKDALKNSRNKNMTVLNLMEILNGKLKEEELKEGMQSDHETDDDDKNEQNDIHELKEEHKHHHIDNESETEYDEHIWLSLRNAKIICQEICNALCQKDSENAATYRTNLDNYTKKLDFLDQEFSDTIKNGSKNTLIFGDRFPFRYFTEDYGLDYYAAFAGCSAETEASFETIIFLAGKLDELGLLSILKIEKGDGKIAKTIVQNSRNKNAEILTLDSMQSVTQKQLPETSYLTIMEKNLEAIKIAVK